ncbi:Cytochrome P450 [Sesbania bispinosa]|nr:Cytochrome P450 [Sesbania bispinosa]
MEMGDTLPYAFAMSVVLRKMEMTTMHMTIRNQLITGIKQVITGNPAIVQHILKTRFSNYQKGTTFTGTLSKFLGTGIFNTNGDNWKFQRQVASHEFNTKSLRKFVEHVVDAELSDRLIPILTSASATQDQVLDFQDILQRFAFDNICKIAFGFDPEYPTASVERSKFAQAFEDATEISSKRFREPFPLIWKIKKQLNIGSEKKLRMAVREVREFARKIVREKKARTEGECIPRFGGYVITISEFGAFG